MALRKADITDIKALHALINESAKQHEMLPRSLNDLYEHVRDIIVYEEDGRICGVCALHVLWEDLAEIRSLAVKEGFQGRGVGGLLIRRALREAKALGIKRVFALTYKPDFFEKMGFTAIDKSKLPHKIWGDCIRCPKFPDCDEEALIKEISP